MQYYYWKQNPKKWTKGEWVKIGHKNIKKLWYTKIAKLPWAWCFHY